MRSNKWEKWSNRDWGWLTAILVGIIILILTFRLGDNQEVVNLFSFISSSVSIALAGVAIYMAKQQESDNNRTTSIMRESLVKIEAKVDSMDGKINDLNFNDFTESTKNKILEEITNKQPEGKEIDKQEIAEIVNKNFAQLNNEFSSYMDNSDRCAYIIDLVAPDDNMAIEKLIFDLVRCGGSLSYEQNEENLRIFYSTTRKITIKSIEKIISVHKEFKIKWIDRTH
ncbi:hypothetical protein [Priestia taiwanensis]|uniref:Uncharacterized protein n=1 Tax=Priestia taiwanensis TaxID=1347902 RepID=A0A917ELT3_9BACI|nr:hypothetical protein [Priestia taiwanensis]MBM7361979.1 hypothetical protein [Priestia taiwanensis]GGE58490.1 hypothetical protein GCM10007140_06050 [Priestia taiwanensis]